MSYLTITVCGHVDSGKTRFIDTLTHLNVVAKEHGRITQKLSLYELDLATVLNELNVSDKIDRTTFSKLLILDTPGHLAFEGIKQTAFAVSDLVLVFTPLIQRVHASIFDLVDTLYQTKIPFLIVFTKLDMVSTWCPGPVFRKNIAFNKAIYDDVIYERILEFSTRGFDLGLYTNLTDSCPFSAISSETKEGFIDLLTIAVREYTYLVQKRKSRERIVYLDQEIGNINYLTGLLFAGSLKPRDLVNLNNTQHSIRRVYATPYQSITLTAELVGPAIFGIELAYRPHIKLADHGLILKTKSKGALEGLCKRVLEENWPIALAEIGPVTKLNKYTVNNEVAPYNLILALYKGVDTATELYGLTLFGLIDKAKARIDLYYSQQTARFNKKYSLAKLSVLSDYIFKREPPYVLGFKLELGTIRQSITFRSLDNTVSFELIELQQNKTKVEVIDTIGNFAGKVITKAPLTDLVSKAIYVTKIDPVVLKPYKHLIPSTIWTQIVKLQF